MSGYPAPDVIWYSPQKRQPPPRSRHRGFGGHLRAVAHAGAFLGLLLAGVVLLALTAGPVVVGVLVGLACYWAVLPAALIAVRRLAVRTSELSARWCGVLIRQTYAPRPAG